jgi:hypothetical protein
LKSKRNSVVGSRAAHNGDTVTSGICAERRNTVTVPLYRRHLFSLSLSLSLSLPLPLEWSAILLPVFFPAFRFHVHGYQSVVVIHQRPSAGDASRADLLDLEE